MYLGDRLAKVYSVSIFFLTIISTTIKLNSFHKLSVDEKFKVSAEMFFKEGPES